MLPIYPGLTAIVQANSTLLPGSAPAPAPAGSSSADSDFPPALLNNMPNFDTAPGLLVTGVPMTANTTQILASTNSTRYMGPTTATFLPMRPTSCSRCSLHLQRCSPDMNLAGFLAAFLHWLHKQPAEEQPRQLKECRKALITGRVCTQQDQSQTLCFSKYLTETYNRMIKCRRFGMLQSTRQANTGCSSVRYVFP